MLGRAVGFPLLIDDYRWMLDVRTKQPGVVLGAQIVLPHSIHPDTGMPVTYLVTGTKHSGSGEWERLGFLGKDGSSNLSQEADRIGRLLRAEMQSNLDFRDRYIRQIVLFVEPGEPREGSKTLDIGFSETAGYVSARPEHLARYEKSSDQSFRYRFDPVNYVGFKWTAGMQFVFQPYRAQSSVGYTEMGVSFDRYKSSPLTASGGSTDPSRERNLISDQGEVPYSLVNQQHRIDSESSPAALMQIRLSERVLHIDDVPIGVRAVEYQGEPLAFLRKLEFNAVWIKGRPAPELLKEAKDAGIWLICSAPEPSELEAARSYDATQKRERDRSSFLSTPLVDPIYDNVLAWNLGEECSNPDHPAYAQRTTVLQSADRTRRRPILCTARSGVREYSRIVDLLMMDRKPLLSSLDLLDLARWQDTYPALARPDTPFWCTIQTDPDIKTIEQWILFGGNAQDICAVTHEQIKLQVYQALAVGTHGLLFTSNTPLTNDDPATEYRRTSLELINWELQLIEEWFAAGRSRPPFVRGTKRGKMAMAVLQSGRTRLLIPIWQERGNQQSVGPAVEGSMKLIISGIPETYGAYHLVPGRLFPLETERVAGGVEVKLDEACLNTLIYFGEIDEVYARIGERAKVIGPRAAYLACRLGELQLASTEQVLSLLKQAREAGAIPIHPQDNLPLIPMQEQESEMKSIKESIEDAKRLIHSTPPAYSTAYLNVEKATRGLRVIAKKLLQDATRHDLNACMTPVSVSFATLPYFLSAYQRTAGATLSPNRLPCGDMESVDLWRQSGWDSRLHRIEGVAPPTLRISPQAQRTGKNGLQIVVSPLSPDEKPIQLETAPIWVISPPSVSVKMGELICVNGWIRIPNALESTVDGLMVFDSLGGEALALRFLETKGTWREFAFYRYVPADANYYIFFAMHGLGEVHLDDLRISAVQFEMPKPAPPPPPPTAPTPWQRLNPFQYLPPLPSWGQ